MNAFDREFEIEYRLLEATFYRFEKRKIEWSGIANDRLAPPELRRAAEGLLRLLEEQRQMLLLMRTPVGVA